MLRRISRTFANNLEMHVEVHARVVLLIDGLGLAYTDLWSQAPTRVAS